MAGARCDGRISPTVCGIAGAAEIDIDTLAVRMHEDALMHERVMFLPHVVGAWTALPPGE
jgi:hypothetical protein